MIRIALSLGLVFISLLPQASFCYVDEYDLYEEEVFDDFEIDEYTLTFPGQCTTHDDCGGTTDGWRCCSTQCWKIRLCPGEEDKQKELEFDSFEFDNDRD